MRIIKKGATSQSIYFDILDNTSSTGGRKTGLAYNTSSLLAYYVRNGASPVAITLATLAAANSNWSSGGFKEVDSTNMPGIYRLDVPDAAFVSGVDSVVITLQGAAGMAQVSMAVQLVAVDLQDATALGVSRIDASISSRLASSSYTAPDNTSITAIKAKTDNLPSDPADASDIAGAFTALQSHGDSAWATATSVTVSDKTGFSLTAAYDFAKGTVAVTESYASNGAAPTPVQLLMALHQDRFAFSISTTTKTVQKLDNTTTAYTVTYDSATAPTAAHRS